MGKRKCRYRFFIILFIPAFFSVYFFLPVQEALVFQYQNSGKVLAYLPISKGDHFQIKYTHSIHLSDVFERYKVTKDRQIREYEMIYEDFAIGMPENASNGEVFQQKNGKFYISNMNRKFPYFDLRLGKVRANHTIIYHEKEYLLSKYIEPGTWVRIKIDRINVWEKWRGVNILESII